MDKKFKTGLGVGLFLGFYVGCAAGGFAIFYDRVLNRSAVPAAETRVCSIPPSKLEGLVATETGPDRPALAAYSPKNTATTYLRP